MKNLLAKFYRLKAIAVAIKQLALLMANKLADCIDCCSEELKQILGLPYKRQYNAINKLVASGVVSVEHKNGPTSARFIAINYDKAQKYVE